MDSITHELKRKDLQIKDLQTRLDAGDGCKYLRTIESSCSNELNPTKFLMQTQKSFNREQNFIPIVVIHAIVTCHAMFIVCKHFNLYNWFGR